MPAALNQSLNNLDSKLSGRTSVNVPQGRYAAANYESLIRRKYVDATIHPGTISGDPVVKAQLVIARNGNVLSAGIIGVPALASWTARCKRHSTASSASPCSQPE